MSSEKLYKHQTGHNCQKCTYDSTYDLWILDGSRIQEFTPKSEVLRYVCSHQFTALEVDTATFLLDMAAKDLSKARRVVRLMKKIIARDC